MVVEIGGMYVAKWTNNDGTYTNIVPEWPFMCSWGTDLVWLDQDDWRLPTKDELIGSTIIVLVSLAMLSIFIGVCDIVLSKIVNIIMTRV